MANPPQLDWLPLEPLWRERLRSLGQAEDARAKWDGLVALANTRLDFVRTNAVDAMARRLFPDGAPPGLQTKPVRLALMGSATMAHLHGAIRVAGLRRGIWIDIYENDYGQYLQALSDPGSGLYAFGPTAVLLALDAQHLTGGFNAGQGADEAGAALEEALDKIKQCWRLAKDAFGCPVIQQTVLNSPVLLMGANEHRLPGSRAWAVHQINAALRTLAETEGVDLLGLDLRVGRDGLLAWHDSALWHRSKQEVTPAAAPMYGELLARILAARQGRSYKCLVLDLDNTLWGGVVGDDGLEGIVIGQGSGLGEGFAAVQTYALELSRRGVILALCSKNDEANAMEPFDKHPEMVLRRSDIASVFANWNDKAANIRQIAEALNIGLDSLVFLDDNPFERALVREELPMVAVPEAPEDPALVPELLAAAGYFEGLALTADDRSRTEQYQVNKARESLKASSTDIEGYLRSLGMQLVWRRFDKVGLQRTVQLINKTNQFNLTTRRYGEADVVAVMDDPRAVGLQLRLLDRFGDNGVIAILIGRLNEVDALVVDTWLMSCRVLGRQVEQATLNLIAAEAARLGARRLIGEYIPTAKNGMVRDHYAKLGFQVTETRADGGGVATLELADFAPIETFIETREG